MDGPRPIVRRVIVAGTMVDLATGDGSGPGDGAESFDRRTSNSDRDVLW